jgi:hypothetical protein
LHPTTRIIVAKHKYSASLDGGHKHHAIAKRLQKRHANEAQPRNANANIVCQGSCTSDIHMPSATCRFLETQILGYLCAPTKLFAMHACRCVQGTESSRPTPGQLLF